MIFEENHSQMYSLYPRWRNNNWIEIRDKLIQNTNPFHNFGMSERFRLICESFIHPEARRFLFCVKHEQPKKQFLCLLAEEGSILAIAFFGFYYYDINQFERLEWFGQVLKFGRYQDFLTMIEPYVRSKIDNHISLVYIGRYLIKGFDFKSRRIFGLYVSFHTFQFSQRSVECYNKQIIRCRKAVDVWTLIATRFRIYKDLRIFIGKMIWESRNEEIYF